MQTNTVRGGIALIFTRLGSMDFQNRVGSKVGSGGVASASESNRDRKERLRLLALETIDLAKVCLLICLLA